jgi:hypothetical protein
MPKTKRTLLEVIALAEKGAYDSSEDETEKASCNAPAVRGSKSLDLIPTLSTARLSPTPSKAGSQSLREPISGKRSASSSKRKKMSHHLSLSGHHKHHKHDKDHGDDDGSKSMTSESSRGSHKHKKKHEFGIHIGNKKSDSNSSSASSSSESEDKHGEDGKKKKKRSKVKRMASDAKDNIKKIFKRKKKKGKKESDSSNSDNDDLLQGRVPEEYEVPDSGSHAKDGGADLQVNEVSSVDFKLYQPTRSRKNRSVSNSSKSSDGSMETQQAMFDQLSSSTGTGHVGSGVRELSSGNQLTGSGSVGAGASVEEVTLHRTGSNRSLDSHKSVTSDESSSSKGSRGKHITGSYDLVAPDVSGEGKCDLEIGMTQPRVDSWADDQVGLDTGLTEPEASNVNVYSKTVCLDDEHFDLDIDMTVPNENVHQARSNVGGEVHLEKVNDEESDVDVESSVDITVDTPSKVATPDSDELNVIITGAGKVRDGSAPFVFGKYALPGGVDHYGELHNGGVDASLHDQNTDTSKLIEKEKQDVTDAPVTSKVMKQKVEKDRKKSGVPWSRKDESGEKNGSATTCCFCFWF